MADRSISRKVGQEITGTVKTARMHPDMGAVHNDRLAKSAGLKGGFIVNEYHFAQLTQMLLEYFGPRWFTHGEIEVRYIAPLLDKDTFIPKARIIGEEPPGSGRVVLNIWCQNQNGHKLAVGKASCLAPEGVA